MDSIVTPDTDIHIPAHITSILVDAPAYADGRQFGVGDSLTLSDMALTSAMAPLVLPPAYAARLPALDSMPAEMQLLAKQFQSRPIGSYVCRIFALVLQ